MPIPAHSFLEERQFHILPTVLHMKTRVLNREECNYGLTEFAQAPAFRPLPAYT